MAAKRPLTTRQILAAHRLVEDRLSDRQIADECDISETQLRRWKRNPQFRALLKSLGKKFDDSLVHVGIASKRGRLEQYADRYRRMRTLIDERANSAEMQGVAGGKTGLLVKQFKIVGTGKNAEKVEEFAFDAALFREMRELEKQTSMELGQWVEKVAPTSPDGEREFGEISEAERLARIEALFTAAEKRVVASQSTEPTEPEPSPETVM